MGRLLPPAHRTFQVSAFSFGLFGDGDVAATITQTMSGQVDVGWSVAPFVLDAIAKGEVRMIARASDLAAARAQTKTINGIAESVQDAVQFKFLPAPPSQDQLSELIRIPAGS